MRKCLIALFLLTAILAVVSRSDHQVSSGSKLPLRSGLSASERVTMDINQTNLTGALAVYSELTGRTELPDNSSALQRLDEFFGGYLSRWHITKRIPHLPSGLEYHRDGLFSVAEVKAHLEALFALNGVVLVPDGKRHFRVLRPPNSG